MELMFKKMKNLMFQITVKNISAVDFFENLCKQK